MTDEKKVDPFIFTWKLERNEGRGKISCRNAYQGIKE
jgi:hypothetical protein